MRLSLNQGFYRVRSKVSGALRMTAIAIDFNCITRPFTRGAAILTVRLRWTATRRVLTLFFLFVCHDSLLK